MPLFWPRKTPDTACEPSFEIYQRFHRVSTDLDKPAHSSEWPSIDRYLGFSDIEFPVENVFDRFDVVSEKAKDPLLASTKFLKAKRRRSFSRSFRKPSVQKCSSGVGRAVSPSWARIRPILKNRDNSNVSSEKENLLKADTVPFTVFLQAFEKTERERENNAPKLSSVRWAQIKNYYQNSLMAM